MLSKDHEERLSDISARGKTLAKRSYAERESCKDDLRSFLNDIKELTLELFTDYDWNDDPMVPVVVQHLNNAHSAASQMLTVAIFAPPG